MRRETNLAICENGTLRMMILRDFLSAKLLGWSSENLLVIKLVKALGRLIKKRVI